MNAKDFAQFAKIIESHQKLINALAQTSADHACIIIPTLERCSKTSCTNAATVKQKYLNILMCDRCAAETIVNAGHLFSTDEFDVMNPIRATLMREVDWEDVLDAERIRRTEQYVSIIKSATDYQKH